MTAWYHRRVKLASCVPAPGLALVLGGCSLLFTPAESSIEDAGAVLDGSPAMLDADSAADLSRAFHTIGTNSATDFASFAIWKSVRSGDLANRQELLVSVEGDSEPLPGVVLTGDLGCEGVLRGQVQFGERMTIDLTSGADCQLGERLSVSSSLEVAQVTEAGPRGIIETVQLRHRTYQAPIVIDGFVNTSALHYLVVEANPATPHKGLAGAGVIIGNVSQLPAQPSNGVEIYVDHTQLRGFEITNWALGSAEAASLEGVHVAANRVLLDRLLIHDDGAARELIDANSDGIYSSQDGIELTVRNSFIYNVARAGILFQSMTSGLLKIQNCTLHNCTAADAQLNEYGCVAASNAAVLVEVINTLAFGRSDAQPAFIVSPASSFAPASSSNASDDGTHPGQDGALVASGPDLLEQALGGANDDLHLQLSAILEPPYDGGKTLLDFDVDIDGETRGSSWSIGADQP